MPKRHANYEGIIYPDRTGWRVMLTQEDGGRISNGFLPVISCADFGGWFLA
jgi:hypothetical protein